MTGTQLIVDFAKLKIKKTLQSGFCNKCCTKSFLNFSNISPSALLNASLNIFESGIDNVWQSHPSNPSAAEFFIVRITLTSSNVDNIPVFEDLEEVFDFTRYFSSKRNQYKGGTGELGDALKRMLKMGYASWTSHRLNEGKPDLQWEEPIILTFNKKRYCVLLHVDTEIDEANVTINPDYDAVINSTDTVVSVAIPTSTSYAIQVDRLRQYYDVYKIPKIRTNFSFNEGPPPA